jgi:hypothetical protein
MAGCKKETSNPAKPGTNVEFYLLKSYTTLKGSAEIIESWVELNDEPIITYDDIEWYNSSTHTFKVTKSIADWLNNFKENPIHGKAFAVALDKKVIYTGYFWAGYSSAGCNWLVIDPLNYSGRNELIVRLGYPGLIQGTSIKDNRNNAELIMTFECDNKLRK